MKFKLKVTPCISPKTILLIQHVLEETGYTIVKSGELVQFRKEKVCSNLLSFERDDPRDAIKDEVKKEDVKDKVEKRSFWKSLRKCLVSSESFSSKE